VRLDGSPKPAYEALLGLVKGEWWLEPTPMVTDAQGKLSFSGFLGDYEVSDGGRAADFQLAQKGPAFIEVSLPG
jgi:hypothetical protein